jgi:hypothetical protein
MPGFKIYFKSGLCPQYGDVDQPGLNPEVRKYASFCVAFNRNLRKYLRSGQFNGLY